MTIFQPFLPRREIAFLVFEDFQVLDAAGPLAAFEIAARYRPGAYRLRTIAAGSGAVRSSSGLSVAVEPMEAGAGCDTLIVAGGEGTRAAATDPAVLDFIRGAAPRARRIASVFWPRLGKSSANVTPGRGKDNNPPEVRSPKRFNTANIEPWPLAAIRINISRKASRAAAGGMTHWYWKNPRLPYSRFHSNRLSNG